MTDETENEESTAGEEGGSSKGGKGKLFIIIGVVVLLVGGGAGFMLMGSGGAEEEVEVEHQVHYERISLGTFVVNLSEKTDFLKVTIVLEYNPELLHQGGDHGGGAHGAHGAGGGGGGDGGSGLPGVMAEREDQIKDSIIRVLSARRVADVLSVDGKEELKEELIEAINEAIGLEEGPVVGIYFTEFILQ